MLKTYLRYNSSFLKGNNIKFSLFAANRKKSLNFYVKPLRNFSSNFIKQKLNYHQTMSVFKFSDYDCIGFDLDSTIIQYNVKNLALLEYEIITNFLINNRNYDSKKLKQPVTDEDFDFLQKGLFLDFEKGNIVKLTPEGNVHMASHGTKFLSTEEIENFYPNKEWELGKIFAKDPLITWNGPLSQKIRTLLNTFDMVSALVFARAVDSLDEINGQPLDKYNVYPDILASFNDMYSREQFQNNKGNFFSELKANPSKYIHKCDTAVLSWIKKLKENQKTFLVTGSNSDFVELTTGYALGDGWKSLFDTIVCYARKPGFFTGNRPFYSLKNYYEDKEVTGDKLEINNTYNQGNWKELKSFFSRLIGKNNPKCLYVGDDLLQDIYAPSQFTDCDTVAISDEQLAEKMIDHNISHNHESILKSEAWGSFFSLKTADECRDSFWNHLIKKHSKICIPKLEMVSKNSLDQPIKCFVQSDDDKEFYGYYPAKPTTMSV